MKIDLPNGSMLELTQEQKDALLKQLKTKEKPLGYIVRGKDAYAVYADTNMNVKPDGEYISIWPKGWLVYCSEGEPVTIQRELPSAGTRITGLR